MGVKRRSLRHPDLVPVHPGTLLAETVIPATAVSRTRIAAMLGVSRQTLHAVLAGRSAVTPALALRLGKLFGNGPKFWLNLQGNYDLWHAERTLRAQLRAMPGPIKAACSTPEPTP